MTSFHSLLQLVSHFSLTKSSCVSFIGVPDAQDDHAPRMAKFAAACQVKMQDLISFKLIDTLGADTADLKLRVGIASGPITAGILRGDRGRFQLFGDVSYCCCHARPSMGPSHTN